MQRTRRGLLVFVAAFTLLSSAPALAEERPELEIYGGGWGHGIGMSQYGAYGQALEGRTAEQILTHYYTGTEVTPLADTIDPSSFMITDSTPLYIGLLQNRTVVRFEAVDAVVKVCQQKMACKRKAKPGEIWELRVLDSGRCRFYRQRPGESVMSTAGQGGPCRAAIKPRRGSRAHMILHDVPKGENEFAYGTVRFRNTSDRKLNVSLEIGMEDYLLGIAEALLHWPDAALETQAIAARSYAAQKALAIGPEIGFSQDRKDDCRCHLYNNTYDQKYIGYANERSPYGQNWVRAVQNTAGMIVNYNGTVAATFYSSSTGGATENVEDMWNGPAVPYLRSVEDPWSIASATGNPRANWTESLQEWELAQKLGLHQVDGMEIVERFVSGTPSRIDIYGRINGEPVVLQKTGPQLRSSSTLGLYSGQIRSIDIGPGTLWAGNFAGDGTTQPAVRLHFNNAWWVDGTSGSSIESVSVANFSNVSSEAYVVGDFDGDGIDEPARFNLSSGEWSVARSGSGSALGVWASLGSGSWAHPVAADFDRDGDSDAAVFDVASGTWHVLISTGTEFVAGEWYSFGSPMSFEHVTAGDFDDDRRSDIVAIDATTGTVITLFSNGSELIYRAWSSVPVSTGLSGVVVGDLNADGRDDWAAYEPSAGTWWVTVAPETGRKAAAAVPWVTYPGAGSGWLYHGAIDIDGDGAAEIVGYRATTGEITATEPTDDGFATVSWGTVAAGNAITDMIGGDLDGDGDADLIGYDDASRAWTVIISDGTASVSTTSAGKLL